jgi:dienelactone hydrolase
MSYGTFPKTNHPDFGSPRRKRGLCVNFEKSSMTISPKMTARLPGILSCFLVIATAAIPAAAAVPWNLKALSNAPQVYPAPGFQEEGVRALFFEGLPWRGKPTRVFAWYGLPANRGSEKVPAMVLVHGGGGTAFAKWVKMWNDKGYAAIAIDTCGSVPTHVPAEGDSKATAWQHHEFGGPSCWDASFEQIDWTEKDQWTYHAIADIALANSLLRSFPEIDKRRIGITGISWGGYLTAIAASVDDRFRFAVPVYGCGFLGENSFWAPAIKKMGEKGRRWLDLWDPSVYLARAKMPFLWLDGTNDFAYPLDSLQKSYRLPRGPRYLSIHLRMEHSHGAGQTPEEIFAFADQILKSGSRLAAVSPQKVRGRDVQVSYKANGSIARAELLYTMDSGDWEHRRWQSVPAGLNQDKHVARATLPEGAKVFFINLIDGRGLVVSSDFQTF